MPRTDGLAQRHDAARWRVLRFIFLDRLDPRFLDVIGRGEIRLTGAEVRNIDSARFELFCFDDHRRRRRDLYAVDAIR